MAGARETQCVRLHTEPLILEQDPLGHGALVCRSAAVQRSKPALRLLGEGPGLAGPMIGAATHVWRRKITNASKTLKNEIP